MLTPKRDVYGYIDKSIEYERGSDTKAPHGGFAFGLDRQCQWEEFRLSQAPGVSTLAQVTSRVH